MPNPISITINDPCFESWKEMTPTCEGRFCNVCEKVVVDFTTMSDGAIVDYLSATGETRVCGRVNKNQLNRPLIKPTVKKPMFNIIGLFSRVAAVLVLAPANLAVAQTKHSLPQHVENSAKKERHPQSSAHTNILRGQILDKTTGKPIAGVRVSALNETTTTNAAGKFQFNISPNYNGKTIRITSVAPVLDRESFEIQPYTIATSKARKGQQIIIYGQGIVFVEQNQPYISGVITLEHPPAPPVRLE